MKKLSRTERKTQRRNEAVARQTALLQRGHYIKTVTTPAGITFYEPRTPAPIYKFTGGW